MLYLGFVLYNFSNPKTGLNVNNVKKKKKKEQK